MTVAKALPKGLIDSLLAGYQKPEDLIGEQGLLKQLTKALVERALEAKMEAHLGHAKNEPVTNTAKNTRNGKSSKTLKGEFGELPLDIPRDRHGSFEPQLIPKPQTRWTGFDDKILSLYARGMTVREIQSHLEEMYGTEVSPSLISSVTDAIADEVKMWSWKLRAEVAAGLKMIYTAATADEAEQRLNEFEAEWGADYPSIVKSWRSNWSRIIPLFDYKRDMIVLLSFRGREHSKLSAYDKLGPFGLIRFTGEYDLLGNPTFTSGDILLESVYRFKGQAAPCIIMTEVDFESLDEVTVRKLFVGSTRATMKLVVVISDRTVSQLL